MRFDLRYFKSDHEEDGNRWASARPPQLLARGASASPSVSRGNRPLLIAGTHAMDSTTPPTHVTRDPDNHLGRSRSALAAMRDSAGPELSPAGGRRRLTAAPPIGRSDEHPPRRGRARARRCSKATPEEYHYNPLGIVHGGLAATFSTRRWACCGPLVPRRRRPLHDDRDQGELPEGDDGGHRAGPRHRHDRPHRPEGRPGRSAAASIATDTSTRTRTSTCLIKRHSGS